MKKLVSENINDILKPIDKDSPERLLYDSIEQLKEYAFELVESGKIENGFYIRVYHPYMDMNNQVAEARLIYDPQRGWSVELSFTGSRKNPDFDPPIIENASWEEIFREMLESTYGREGHDVEKETADFMRDIRRDWGREIKDVQDKAAKEIKEIEDQMNAELDKAKKELDGYYKARKYLDSK